MNYSQVVQDFVRIPGGSEFNRYEHVSQKDKNWSNLGTFISVEIYEASRMTTKDQNWSNLDTAMGSLEMPNEGGGKKKTKFGRIWSKLCYSLLLSGGGVSQKDQYWSNLDTLIPVQFIQSLRRL